MIWVHKIPLWKKPKCLLLIKSPQRIVFGRTDRSCLLRNHPFNCRSRLVFIGFYSIFPYSFFYFQVNCFLDQFRHLHKWTFYHHRLNCMPTKQANISALPIDFLPLLFHCQHSALEIILATRKMYLQGQNIWQHFEFCREGVWEMSRVTDNNWDSRIAQKNQKYSIMLSFNAVPLYYQGMKWVLAHFLLGQTSLMAPKSWDDAHQTFMNGS